MKTRYDNLYTKYGFNRKALLIVVICVIMMHISPSGYSQTQNCDTLIVTKTDKVTGIITRGIKESLIVSNDGKTGFNIYLFEGTTSLILSITVAGGSSCIDNYNKINILFRDGTRDEIITNTQFNCDASSVIYFGGGFGRRGLLKNLRTKEIETMRVWTSGKHIDQDFTTENSMALLASLRCLEIPKEE